MQKRRSKSHLGSVNEVLIRNFRIWVQARCLCFCQCEREKTERWFSSRSRLFFYSVWMMMMTMLLLPPIMVESSSGSHSIFWLVFFCLIVESCLWGNLVSGCSAAMSFFIGLVLGIAFGVGLVVAFVHLEKSRSSRRCNLVRDMGINSLI